MASPADSLESVAESLCAAARWCYGRGWAPATSGNFSVRVPDLPGSGILITPSGLDKGTVMPADLIRVEGDGGVVGSRIGKSRVGEERVGDSLFIAGSGKPSAEVGLHLTIYHGRPEAGAILHVHSVWNTLLSAHHASRAYAPFEGYEILKGLAGVTTHAHLERVPILEDSQDYDELCRNMARVLDEFPRAHGVLLSRHGLYTWGQSVAEARRHLEALEFLFEVEGRRLIGKESIVPDILT